MLGIDDDQVWGQVTSGLRDDLHAAGYTTEGIVGLLGPVAHAAALRGQLVPARLAVVEEGGPLPTMVRLFMLAESVSAEQAAEAFPRAGVDQLCRLTVLRSAGDGRLRAGLDVRPYRGHDCLGAQEWWVVSDLGEHALGEALPTGHVLGIGGAATTLAQATVRHQVGSCLDLGTGCGVQALHAARHARQIVATDVDERALQLARLNFALAGVEDQVELLAGDMLAPVAGRQFDLVVSNPPFVITPRSGDVPTYTYRDAGRVGDGLVAELARTVESVLAPGGVAQFMANWEIRQGEAWDQCWHEWLADTGLDAWVIQREVEDPATYTERWIRDGGTSSGASYQTMYRAWLDDLASRDVAAIGLGFVTLRRPTSDRRLWRRFEDFQGPWHQPFGQHVDLVLAGMDALAARSDEEIAQLSFNVLPDVTESRHFRPGAGQPSAIVLQQDSGLGRAIQLPAATASLVGAYNGDRQAPLAALAAAVAKMGGVEPAEVLAEALPRFKQLVEAGMLTPVEFAQ